MVNMFLNVATWWVLGALQECGVIPLPHHENSTPREDQTVGELGCYAVTSKAMPPWGSLPIHIVNFGQSHVT